MRKVDAVEPLDEQVPEGHAVLWAYEDELLAGYPGDWQMPLDCVAVAVRYPNGCVKAWTYSDAPGVREATRELAMRLSGVTPVC